MAKSNFTSSTTWFILIGEGLDKVNRGGSHSFRGYSDHVNAHNRGHGTYIQYSTSRDEKGKEIGKWFTMNESFRKLMVRPSDKDINGVSQYEFLKFSPDCEGSPNGYYVEIGPGNRVQQGVMFRELNSAKDASVALEAEERVNEAKSSVLKLDDATLSEMASVIGVFGEPDALMKIKVLEWAGKRPVEYFAHLNAGDRNLRAIIRKSVAEGIFTQKGELIYWENELIGSNEDEAVGTLSRNKQMLDALQNKTALGTTATAETNRGRPKGSKKE